MKFLSPRKLLKISRPRFWLYLFGPYLVGLVAGGWRGEAAEYLPWLIIFAWFWLFPANLFLYGVNDIADHDTDSFNDKKDSYEIRLERSAHYQLLFLLIFLTVPLVIASFFTTTWPAILLFVALGSAYSLPPLRFKAHPFVDSLSNVLYITPAITGYLITAHSWPEFSYLLAGGLWAISMHAFSAVPDIQADRQANLTTTAVLFGKRATTLLCAALFLASGLAASFIWVWWALLLALPHTTLCLAALKYSPARIYRFFPYVNALSGFCLFWLIILNAGW